MDLKLDWSWSRFSWADFYFNKQYWDICSDDNPRVYAEPPIYPQNSFGGFYVLVVSTCHYDGGTIPGVNLFR